MSNTTIRTSRDPSLPSGATLGSSVSQNEIGATTARILFVCTGNTCRSPMAEGLCRRLAKQEGALEMQVASAGIDAAEGTGASAHALAVMGQMGIDLSNHRARRLNAEIAQDVDLILGMTPQHAEQARAIVGTTVPVGVLGDYAGIEEAVDDPFGGSAERYRRTAQQIQRLLTAALCRRVGGEK